MDSSTTEITISIKSAEAASGKIILTLDRDVYEDLTK